ncbi:HNH endonuclease [Amycolatopsis sp. cmx-4-68]|uniref:HNH endonuclease n=1 Tax=Amycolatopsis sp. cmx-4-68 TaxID=2790938 RepID=UPI00397E0A11
MRKSLPLPVRRQVLTEAGYRCAVPTCRGILALDIHHMVEVQEGGRDTPENLIALCPTCHALYTRGTIAKEAVRTYKAVLVSLNAAFDREGIDNLLFLSITSTSDDLIITGDGVLRFGALIAAGYAQYELLAEEINPGFMYRVSLTPKGSALIQAWKSGDRSNVADILGGLTQEGLIEYLKAQKEAAAPLVKWISGGLQGHEYNDARVMGDDWASPIFRRLLAYDTDLARIFNDDDEPYSSTKPGEFMERRFRQLQLVIDQLE